MEQTFDEMLDWFANDQHEYGQPHGNSKDRPITEAAGNPESSTNPDGRRSGKARHMTAGIAQNYARAEKSNPGENTLEDSANSVWVDRPRVTGEPERDDRGHGRSKAD